MRCVFVRVLTSAPRSDVHFSAERAVHIRSLLCRLRCLTVVAFARGYGRLFSLTLWAVATALSGTFDQATNMVVFAQYVFQALTTVAACDRR